MTTTARGRIPRLICACCLSSALLISTSAATAVAAPQSPMPGQQIPGDDSGGSDQGSDSGGSGSSSGTGDHPSKRSDNGGSDTGNQSDNESDTGRQPSNTDDHPSAPSDNGGGNADNGASDNYNVGGNDQAAPYRNQPGLYNRLNPVQKQALDCASGPAGDLPRVLKLTGKTGQLSITLTQAFVNGYAVGEDLNTGDTYNLIWDIGASIPVAGDIVSCVHLGEKIGEQYAKQVEKQTEAETNRKLPGIKNQLNKAGPVKIPAPTGLPNPQGVAKNAG
ncbi:hypothetical protein [Kitasatospora sp. NPDC058190]|uniref:hypothetical protein n=1 Tax=Kitasatospora sp. NPDC058190 TaxID=3346371 RepID=UPI0036DC5C23